MSDIDIDAPTFTNRADYLAWRAAWREAYAELSATIRAGKQERSTLLKTGEPAGAVQVALRRQRSVASTMLEVRLASKQQAAIQYRADRARQSITEEMPQ